MIGPHSAWAEGKAVVSIRTSAANTAAFVPTAMKAVTGVGAPSYTSGTHMWKGTSESLKAKPTSTSPSPTISIGLGSTPPLSAWAIPGVVQGASRAVDQGRSIDQQADGEGTEEEVLQCRLFGGQSGAGEPGENVQGEGEDLDPHQQHYQVGGRGHHQHSGSPEDQQGEELGIGQPHPLRVARRENHDQRRRDEGEEGEEQEEVVHDHHAAKGPTRRVPRGRSQEADADQPHHAQGRKEGALVLPERRVPAGAPASPGPPTGRWEPAPRCRCSGPSDP